jgi:LMBR1 domain-containing protein 1
VAIIIANLYFLVYFQHEDDRNQAYFPKVIVLLGLTLAEFSVLLLPFDIAVSRSGDTHRQNMELVWQVVYMSIIFMLVVVIPFVLFYYESEDPDDKGVFKQVKQALQIEFCTIVIVLLGLLLMFFFLGIADVPVRRFTTKFEKSPASFPSISFNCPSTADCKGKDAHLEIPVTFPVYTMGLASWVGWFLFVLFAGVGLAALPIDLFHDFKFRPRRLPLDEFVKQKLEVNKRAADLKRVGEKLIQDKVHQSKKKTKIRMMARFKKAVYFLERDWEKLQESSKGGGNPLVYYGYLVLSFITFGLTICWLIHIVIFMLVRSEHKQPFLNTMFVKLDGVFGFLGTIFYGMFAFYLIWATIKGNMKMGLRLVFFTIHPMKLGATMMNSFLFNVGLILLCSIPVVQFCTTAFALYAHGSAIENLFGIQVTNLKFLRYFFLNNVFLYALFILAALTLIYLLVCPDKRRNKKEDIRDDEDAWLAF